MGKQSEDDGGGYTRGYTTDTQSERESERDDGGRVEGASTRGQAESTGAGGGCDERGEGGDLAVDGIRQLSAPQSISSQLSSPRPISSQLSVPRPISSNSSSSGGVAEVKSETGGDGRVRPVAISSSLSTMLDSLYVP